MWSTSDRMAKRKPTKHSVGIWYGLLANSQTLRQTGGFCIKARQCLYPESWSWNVMNCGPRFRHFSRPWFFTLGKRNKNLACHVRTRPFSCGSHWDTFFSTFSEGWTMLCLCYAMKPNKDAMFSAPSGIEFKDVDPQADQFNGGLDHIRFSFAKSLLVMVENPFRCLASFNHGEKPLPSGYD